MTPDDVLQFWLGAPALTAAEFSSKIQRWFRGSPEFDQEVRARYGSLVERARDGALDDWAATPRGRLALIIVLDQFTRNLYRGTPRAFENDARGLVLAEAGLAKGEDAGLSFEEKIFLYLPLGHSEDVSCQERHVALVQAAANAAPTALEKAWSTATAFARGYLEQIRRFGRFPHRNVVLGRTCTQEEMAFLASSSPTG